MIQTNNHESKQFQDKLNNFILSIYSQHHNLNVLPEKVYKKTRKFLGEVFRKREELSLDQIHFQFALVMQVFNHASVQQPLTELLKRESSSVDDGNKQFQNISEEAFEHFSFGKKSKANSVRLNLDISNDRLNRHT